MCEDLQPLRNALRGDAVGFVPSEVSVGKQSEGTHLKRIPGVGILFVVPGILHRRNESV